MATVFVLMGLSDHQHVRLGQGLVTHLVQELVQGQALQLEIARQPARKQQLEESVHVANTIADGNVNTGVASASMAVSSVLDQTR